MPKKNLAPMVIVIIKFKALPEKYLELKQTLEALMKPTRKEKGCLSHNVLQDIENDEALSLIEIWETRRDLDARLRADGFTVLMGTRILLSRPPEITISELSDSFGWEAVQTVRQEIVLDGRE